MSAPNLPKLREAYIKARRAWLAVLNARAIDLYSDEAEGGFVGRGAHKQRDELGKLFDAHEAARDAYINGEKP